MQESMTNKFVSQHAKVIYIYLYLGNLENSWSDAEMG